MSNPKNLIALKKSVFTKFSTAGRKVTELGQRARRTVFGFHHRSTAHIDRWALPVKILYEHRIIQRKRAFKKSGGNQSSIALYALEKARHKEQS